MVVLLRLHREEGGGGCYILLYGDRDRYLPPQLPAGSFVKGGSGPTPDGGPVAAGRALCRAAEAKCRPHGPPAIPCPPEARPLPAAGPGPGPRPGGREGWFRITVLKYSAQTQTLLSSKDP